MGKIHINDVLRKSLSPVGYGSVTRVTIDDTTPTVLFSTAITNQSDFAVKNLDTAETLYIGFLDTISASANSWPLSPGESFALDLKGIGWQETDEPLLMYGISSSGNIEAAVMLVGHP